MVGTHLFKFSKHIEMMISDFFLFFVKSWRPIYIGKTGWLVLFLDTGWRHRKHFFCIQQQLFAKVLTLAHNHGSVKVP